MPLFPDALDSHGTNLFPTHLVRSKTSPSATCSLGLYGIRFRLWYDRLVKEGGFTAFAAYSVRFFLTDWSSFSMASRRLLVWRHRTASETQSSKSAVTPFQLTVPVPVQQRTIERQGRPSRDRSAEAAQPASRPTLRVVQTLGIRVLRPKHITSTVTNNTKHAIVNIIAANATPTWNIPTMSIMVRIRCP